MDKKSIIGIVLIFLIVLGFSYFNRPSDEEVARAQRQRDSIAAVQATQEAEQLAIAIRWQPAQKPPVLQTRFSWLAIP